MPITFEFEPDRQLVTFRHVGDVTDDELLAFYKDFFEDPKTVDYVKLLILLEQTRSSGRSSEALRSLAGLLEKSFERGATQWRVAVVAPGDHSFGLARMYEAFSGSLPWEFRVFRDSDEARAWLGVDLDATSKDEARIT